jgi:adenosylcobinamide kinase/adenosylcobinamide-phosphate guanylyltransferase
MQQINRSPITLVLGGVRSGKSSYAQRLAEQLPQATFIATAERRDDAEMHAKIDRHRAERPAHWTTIEEPLDLAGAISLATPESAVILVDCLTLFASNLMEANGMDRPKHQPAIDQLCAALQASPLPVILVSNEVGSGVVPAYALGRRFRDLVGEINQQVAAVADNVLLLVAGLPLVLKGSVPGGKQ